MRRNPVPAISVVSLHVPVANQPTSLWKLGGLTVSQLARKVFDEIIENNVFGLAAELAFYFLFALFPLILILVTLFGLFASHRVELQNDLLSYFAPFLPLTGITVSADS